MGKIKVLLIQNYITHYNFPVYNLLACHPKIELTVVHSGKLSNKENQNFHEIIIHTQKVGSIFLFKENIFSLCSNYDVVIAMSDIHYLSLMLLGIRKRRSFKLIYWGIGVSASYNNKLDENKKWDSLRFLFMRGADALLFYSEYPIKKYFQAGFSEDKLFVAHNTVEVKKISNTARTFESILFVGTLYKEKGIVELLESYLAAFKNGADLPRLDIIGDGEEFQNIKNWIVNNNLADKVKMHGAIYDDEKLEQFFLSAIVSISPNQAGLSVLKSMGYGVPFITRFDSITGGERLNITDGLTGKIYTTQDELVSILANINKQRDEYRLMGDNALKKYDSSRTPGHMVDGFVRAILYVQKNN